MAAGAFGERTVSGAPQIHRFPQSKYIDAVRFLPPHSALERFIITAVHDTDTDISALEIHALNTKNPNKTPPNLHHKSTWLSPSRISSLRVASQTLTKPLVAASTFSGSLHFLFPVPIDVSLESETSISERSFHAGPISAVDLHGAEGECVTVGEDGRVNLVRIGRSGLDWSRVYDGKGLVSYTAARWGSPAEFATGGLGFGVDWWDKRKPGGAVSQFKGNQWARGTTSGIVHSIDIHPSRKHVCVVGGSSGTVFAWDLRWQQQPILLSGVELSGERSAHPLFESEVWEVQYDSYMQSSSIGSASSSRILPIMMCSEDGILAVLEQGEEPLDVLAEPCAINGFDIDSHNPSDVVCSLEWESIALVMRP